VWRLLKVPVFFDIELGKKFPQKNHRLLFVKPAGLFAGLTLNKIRTVVTGFRGTTFYAIV
jgi:hypothetical protein